MKKLILFFALNLFVCLASFAQMGNIEGKEVYKNEDVVFHQIDEHTWIGTGHVMFNESMYLVEGDEMALLIDAGTNIKNLNKIVAKFTSKPIMLVATHVHPDHTGSAINDFSEIYINAGDTINISQFMPNYKGKIKYLTDGQVIDLGNRKLEVVFTPGHTPGSTCFLDKKSGYGFSGDAFGSGNLLLTLDCSTLIASCQKILKKMNEDGIPFMYPGHYFGPNKESLQRITDVMDLSKDILSGKVKGEENPGAMLGLNLIAGKNEVKIRYRKEAIK